MRASRSQESQREGQVGFDFQREFIHQELRVKIDRPVDTKNGNWNRGGKVVGQGFRKSRGV